MKLKIGALLAVVVAALLIVPPLLGRVSASTAPTEMVLQLDSAQALHNGELQPITAENGAALTPLRTGGTTMLPLRWLAEAMGLTVTWDGAANTVTLTEEYHSKQTQVVFTINDANMTVDGAHKTLSAPATLVQGVTYVPLRAIGEACGWNVHYVEDAHGALVFMDNHRETEAPAAKQIEQALALLGPSRAQMLAGGLIGRVGSGTIVVNGSRVEMQPTKGHYVGAVAVADRQYLPLYESIAALGGTVQKQADGTYGLTLQETTGALTGDALYTDDKKTVYASCQAISAEIGLQYAVSGSVFMMTRQAVSGFADKMAYLTSVAATLPDTRPDIPQAKGYIALTFDDGPTGGKDGLTVRLLNGLKERGAHATFFLCGYRIRDFHTHMERYLAEGHELGNHTMNHPQKPILSKLSVDKIYDEITSNSALIQSYTGQGTTVMRPVGGAVSENLKAAMKKAGQPIINWSVDTLDWKYRDAARIKKVITGEAKDGAIVLMHDLHQPTVDGVLGAIDEMQKQGYAFVTVSELAQIKGVTMEAGKVYTHFETK